jgi:predicted DNA-binding protein YlxM (UPF0122 family)
MKMNFKGRKYTNADVISITNILLAYAEGIINYEQALKMFSKLKIKHNFRIEQALKDTRDRLNGIPTGLKLPLNWARCLLTYAKAEDRANILRSLSSDYTQETLKKLGG